MDIDAELVNRLFQVPLPQIWHVTRHAKVSDAEARELGRVIADRIDDAIIAELPDRRGERY